MVLALRSLVLALVGTIVVAAAGLMAVPGALAAADPVPPLVSVDWLKQHLGAPDLFILDVRSAIDGGGAEAYARGHIPGAVHSDYDKAGWRVTRDHVPFMLPTVSQLEKLIGELGIDEDKDVVVVPAGVHQTDFGSAARVYWTLKIAGLTRVSILDGGYAAWAADPANMIETKDNPPSPTIFTVHLSEHMLAELSEVERIRKAGGATLVDARTPALFAGKEKAPQAAAYGHIPGALNIDSASFYDPATNRLKSKDVLAKIAGRIPSGPAVTYCNTGHWAAIDWFVLHELLGRKDVTLYDGSMVEWAADEKRPVESSRTKWDDLKRTLGFGS
jgi:thiosulfate/3-mercaptopyruvate sulfurtransferase